MTGSEKSDTSDSRMYGACMEQKGAHKMSEVYTARWALITSQLDLN